MEQIRLIFLDTSIWLEYLANTEKSDMCKEIIHSKARIVISTAALMELRYHGIKKFGLEKTAEIMTLIESSDILIVPLAKEIARYSADIRLKYYNREKKAISFIDAVNLATAILTNCDKFFSTDKDFEGVDEIKVEII